MKRYGLVAALAVVLVSNVFVFAGVFYNRSGEPDAELQLTERELSLARQKEENTGLFLKLHWTAAKFNFLNPVDREATWLRKEILKKIGFNTDYPLLESDSYSFYNRQLPRTAWIVLEFDGPLWKEWKQSAEQFVMDKTQELKDEKDKNNRKTLKRNIDFVSLQLVTHTRLFAINAGPDPVELRLKYPDRHRFIIAEGLIRIRKTHYRSTDSKHTKGKPYLSGHITQILIEEWHIPNSYQGLFSDPSFNRTYPPYYLPKGKTSADLKPRYTVSIKYGKKYQPWITDIKPLK